MVLVAFSSCRVVFIDISCAASAFAFSNNDGDDNYVDNDGDDNYVDNDDNNDTYFHFIVRSF